MSTVYENRGGEVWERHPDGRRELFASDIILKLITLESNLAEAREIAENYRDLDHDLTLQNSIHNDPKPLLPWEAKPPC